MHKVREHWSSHLGFLMAAAGSAIGLGTLWKFPYVVGINGGGLFVFVYILCIILIGIPLFMAELSLGRSAQRGAVGTFYSLSNQSTFWKAIGWMGVAASFFIMSYYSVIAGWGLNYVFMSLNQFYEGRTSEEISQVFDIVAGSPDITLFWHLAFVVLTMGVVYPGIRKGIEYWAKIMTTCLFVIMVGLFLFSMTLDGFPQAVEFIFYPDFSNFNITSAVEALGLAFFTLSLGQGVMITYGSYMQKGEDIPKTGFLIGSAIVVIALLSAMIIFPIIFTFGLSPSEGQGLVFKTLPVLFAQLPGAMLLSVTFFTLFVFTALTSSVALVEVVVANCMDLFNWTRKKAVIIVGISCFIFGIPSALSSSYGLFENWKMIYGKTFFQSIDETLVTVWLLPISGVCTAIFAGRVIERSKMKEAIMEGSNLQWVWNFWLFSVRWLVPSAIILIFLQKSGVIDLNLWSNVL